MALRQPVPPEPVLPRRDVVAVPYLPKPSFYGRFGKRAFDIVVGLALFVVAAPIIFVLALLVLVTSGAPVFYGATRVGKDGRPFRMWKLRTMVRDADAIIDYWKRRGTQEGVIYLQSYKLRNDPRITPIGSILRKTSLDELPQLLNVVRGDMSLVGPRPIVESELEKYGDESEVLLSTPPGITGLWQISGRNAIDYPERAQLELSYVQSRSLLKDMSLLLLTAGVLFKLDGR